MTRLVLAFLLLLLGPSHSAAQNNDSWTLYTDTYRPLVAAPDEPESDLMTNVRLILSHAGLNYDLDYTRYSYAEHAVGSGQRAVSFPWRKTDEREAIFNLTRPLATFTTQVFYNRRFWASPPDDNFQGRAKIGLVDSTIYGPRICNFFASAAGEDFRTTDPTVESSGKMLACPFLSENDIVIDLSKLKESDQFIQYPSEAAAIKALLLRKIDFLALPKSVKSATMQSVFPDQSELVQPVVKVEDNSTFHIIAPKTDSGERFVRVFNASYDELVEGDVISPWTFKQALDPEIAPPARLVAAEGFPMIIAYECKTTIDEGETCPVRQRQFYALPQGSRVLVLSWSRSIEQPFSNDEKLYEIMTDETKILTLDAPSIGRELFVKTMHISLSQ